MKDAWTQVGITILLLIMFGAFLGFIYHLGQIH